MNPPPMTRVLHEDRLAKGLRLFRSPQLHLESPQETQKKKTPSAYRDRKNEYHFDTPTQSHCHT